MDFFYMRLKKKKFLYWLLTKNWQKLKLQSIFPGLGIGPPMLGNGPHVLGNGLHMC